jgi:SAM-dependent methyltransferase
MSSTTALIGLIAKARADGIWSALSLAHYRLTVRWMEWRIGIETESIMSTSELGFTNPDFRFYAPTDYRNIGRALQLLDISGSDVLLDMGCGLGRVVLFAAKYYSFRKIIGIDISHHLVAIAQENRARAIRHLSCKEVDIIAADATQYEIPDDVTVIYFANPFAGDALAKVFAAIHASVTRQPRPVRLLCIYPLRSSFAEQMPFDDGCYKEREISLPDDMRCALFSLKLQSKSEEPPYLLQAARSPQFT